MNLIRVLILILIPLNIFAQTKNIESGKLHPTKETFEKKSEKPEYPKFSKSQIIIEENKVTVNVMKSIEFPKELDRKYKIILENGFLDPFEINGNYTLKICCFEEIISPNQNPQIKRFTFWIFPAQNQNPNASNFEKMLTNRINPDEYYFELQNENATENMSYEDFVKNAKLIFLKHTGIII